MPNVGSAYVTLMPSMKGFAAGVNKGISGIDTSSSGKAIGVKTAKGFAGGFASGGIVIGAAAAVANQGDGSGIRLHEPRHLARGHHAQLPEGHG